VWGVGGGWGVGVWVSVVWGGGGHHTQIGGRRFWPVTPNTKRVGFDFSEGGLCASLTLVSAESVPIYRGHQDVVSGRVARGIGRVSSEE